MKGLTLALGTLAGHLCLFLLGRDAPDRQRCEASCHVVPPDGSGLGRAVLGASAVLLVELLFFFFCCPPLRFSRGDARAEGPVALEYRARRPRISHL